MTSASFISLRRLAGFVLIFLLCTACTTAFAQSVPPSVVTSFVTPTANNMEYQAIWNIAVSSHGDVLVMDFQSGDIYQLPSDGRAPIKIITVGGWANPGIAVDSADNLYFGNDWNGGISRIPYDSENQTWNASDRVSWAGDAVGPCCDVWWYHPTAMTTNANNLFVFGIENPSNTIFSMTIDPVSGTYDTATAANVVTGLASRPRSLAVDNDGNIYFYEDGGTAVYRIPAGSTGITGEASLTRMDTNAGANPVGVAVDADGNVYISDSKKGVYLVPNEDGVPNTAHTYLLTPLAAQGTLAVDSQNGFVYVPISKPSAADPTTKVNDVVRVRFDGDLGMNIVSTDVYFAFNGDLSPTSIAFTQDGTPLNSVTVGGNCSTAPDHVYHAGDSCMATLTFLLPGDTEGQVTMSGADGSVIASTDVQVSALGIATPSFSTPTANNMEYQSLWNIAVSSQGDVLVMDFQSGDIYQLPSDGRAPIKIVTVGGWANPGIAVDSADNLYFGNDWNGGISRIPYDPVNRTWNAADRVSWAGDAVGPCCEVWWYHPDPMATNANNLFVFGIENPSNTIFSMTIDPVSGTYDTGTAANVVTGLASRPRSLAVDNDGNIYFYEDGGTAVYRIPAGSTGLTGEASLMRVDTNAGAKPVGVAVDADGNIYISDSEKGVYVVPNENGFPNTAHTYLLTPLAAQGTVAVDSNNRFVYVPISKPSAADPSVNVQDVVKVSFGGDLGQNVATATVNFVFNGDVSPSSFVFLQNGIVLTSVKVTGDCSTDPTHVYHAGDTCTATLTFEQPGSIDGQVAILDAQENPIVTSDISIRSLGVVTGTFANPTVNNIEYQSVWNIARSTHGDVLVMDFQTGDLYQLPSDGRAPIKIITVGGWANPGVATDSADALYFGNDWNGGISRIPYDLVNKTWNAADRVSWGGDAVGPCCGVWWYHPTAMTTNTNNLFVFGIENPSNTIFAMTIDPATGGYDTGSAVNVVTGLASRPRSLAVDNDGNIYFSEDGGTAVYRIAAGSTGLTGESSLMRVDTNTGANPVGVSVDAEGNVYISDSKKGVYVVPNENGFPNTAHTYLLTPLAAQGTIAVDSLTGSVFVPFSKPSAADPSTKIVDISNVSSVGDLGAAAVGSEGVPVTANYVFNGDVSPASLAFVHGGAPADFVRVGGTCSLSATYHVGDTCTALVAVHPAAAGAVSAQLTMQDADYNTLAANYVHGVGQAGMGAFLTQPFEGTLPAGLNTPQQLASDALGNIYVADPGLHQVLQYTSNGIVSVGTGLTAPTGVAVDGNGNVFIADSGNLIMVPFVNGALNAAGQQTILTGLGADAKLAVDRFGNVAVADPGNQRVVKVSYPGSPSILYGQRAIAYLNFTQLTAIGVNANGNLLVTDGANLIQISDDGTRATLLDQLSGVTGIATDPSGAVYIAQAAGAIRIPNENGTLNLANHLMVAPTVVSPSSIALDRGGNVYVGDPTAQNVHVVSIRGTLDFGTLNLGDAPTLNADLFNIGNAPLTITGFTSSNPIDFTATAAALNGCDHTTPTPLGPGLSCVVAATMNPGPGEEGFLSGDITVEGNAANPPVILGLSGTGAALAKSSVSVTVDPAANHTDTPVTVTVTPLEGTGTPTGTVTVSVGAIQATGTLTDGTVTVHLAMVPGGTQTVTAAYGGDRTYGKSTSTATVSIGLSTVAIGVPPDLPPYVLSDSNAGILPATAAKENYLYLMPLRVAASAGIPTGTVTFMEGTAPACPGYPINDSHNTVELDENGNAEFQTSCLYVNADRNVPHPVTLHTITIVYNGDSNYASATSAPITFQVLRNPSILITTPSNNVSVSAGSTATMNLTLTSVAGYGVIGKGQSQHLFDWSGPVDLQCQGLPARTTCSFDPAQVPDVTDGQPGAAVLTIRTNVAVPVTTARNSSPWIYASMFGVGFLGLVFVRRTPYSSRVLLLICALLILGSSIAGLSACGGGTVSSTPTPQQMTTPKGTYTVDITIKQTINQNLVSIPYSFTLTVQ